MKALRYLIPLGVFVILVGFFAVGLMRDPRAVPSPYIDKAAPAFKLETLHDPQRVFTPEDMKGKVWLLNVWASWCVSCRIEHPLLVEMARNKVAPIVGLNYKDKREDGTRWLVKFGDPYALSAWDIDGKVGIDYGVYGAPETFVIDKQGIVRYKQIGPITREVLDKVLMPLIRKLQG